MELTRRGTPRMTTEQRGALAQEVLRRPEVKKKMSEAKMVPVIIEGVEYPSQVDASRTLNINYKTLSTRIHSSSHAWVDWRLAVDKQEDEMIHPN